MNRFIPNLDRIADRAFMPFSYIAKIDDTIGADGQPRKPWRIAMSTLVAAQRAGTLRTIDGNDRATYGEFLKQYIINPKSIKNRRNNGLSEKGTGQDIRRSVR